MNNEKDRRAIGALIIGACVGLVLWVILLALRVYGYTDMHWALVLTGFAWLTWLVYALIAWGALCVYAVMRAWGALYVYAPMRAWRWWRLRNCREVRINIENLRLPEETDEQLAARIHVYRYALANSAALDELAWEDYKTTRFPGETDEELRARLKKIVDSTQTHRPKKTPGCYAWESANKEAET